MTHISLPGFTIRGQLNIGNLTNVYRCIRDDNVDKVIVKSFDMLNGARYEMQDIEHEFYLLKKIHESNPNYTIAPLELIHSEFKVLLVMENVEGMLLSNYLKTTSITVDDFLIIAPQMAASVELLHKLNIIHKEINPSNFLINPANKQLKLVNLEKSELVDSTELSNASILTGNLNYISPEQTGRINRPIDYRTDFYSLGITFYELLAGSPPFHSTDPIEVIHDHVATAPKSLLIKNPEIPEMLDKIIEKLVMKSPDNRYIHATSLLEDLNTCKEQWAANHRITPFELGKQDKKSVLQLSSKIYGIDKQIGGLVQSFYHVMEGEKSFFLISGSGGVGKTTFVNELSRYTMDTDSYFIKGNYDQLQFKTPYSGIILAFNELIQKLLLEPESNLAKIRVNLLEALGNNASVMVSVLPSLEDIIGKQPKARVLNYTEAQNRLIITFKNFIGFFLKEGAAFILFLDNLQWADNASWKLLEEILEDNYLKGLMIISSYRNNEVDENHPLALLKHKLLPKNYTHEIELQPWDINDLTSFLEDTFSMPKSEVLPLAEALLIKTKGNPFYVKNFLNSIYRDNLIYFNSKENEWVWDILNIQNERLSDNVIDFLLHEMDNLSESSQTILKYASCFGRSFNLSDLSQIYKEDKSALLNSIQEIVNFHFLTSSAEVRKAFTLAINASTAFEDLHKLVFEFSHDRVQQAAFSSMPLDMREVIHLAIGRILINESPPQEESPELFTIMDHINQSLSLVKGKKERLLLAHYNLWAGNKAKASVAQVASNNYFHSGLLLIEEQSWEEQYDLLFKLHKGYIETLYLLNEFDLANRLCLSISDKIHTPLEQVELSLIKIYAYMRTNQHKEALAEGIRALSVLDFPIPKKMSKFRFFFEWMRLRFRLGWSFKNLDQIMSPMTDPKDLAISTILDHISALSFQRGNIAFFSRIICISVTFSIQKGYSKYTPYALMTYATAYVTWLSDMYKGRKLLELAETIQRKTYDPVLAVTNDVLKGNFLLPWFFHSKEAFKCLNHAYLECVEMGEIEHASYAIHLYSVGFETSMKLNELLELIERDVVLTERHNNKAAQYYIKAFKLFYLYLVGKADANYEETIDTYVNTINNKTMSTSAGVSVLMGYYIMGNMDKVRQYAQFFSQNKLGLWGVMPDSLIGLLFSHMWLIKKHTASDKKKVIQKTTRLIKKVKHWAESNPENFSFSYLWLSAELAVLTGRNEKAMYLYDDAIENALKNGFDNFVGIISEAASEFYIQTGRPIIAKSYYQLAYNHYLKWGAVLKCQQLTTQYPNLDVNSSSLYSTDGVSTLTKITSKSLDLESIMKASLTISGEVNLEKLLEKILTIALENAGAQIAAFIFKEKEQLKLVSYTQDGMNTMVNLQEGIATMEQLIPLSVIRYVDRTLKTLILNNEDDLSKFDKDEYLKLNQPKSILCLPILNLGKRVGYLYLENRISTTFSKDRLDLLKLLSGEIAISIENAKLYTSIGRFVPYEFIRKLGTESIVDVQLGDSAKKNMSILFSDIIKFTDMSENLDPELTFKVINLFLGYMEPVINKNNGFIDKYIGDALMALFDSAEDAVNAGLDIMEALPLLNDALHAEGLQPIQVGVGISTGSIMTGIVGSKKRVEVTVIGDAVNLASRLEGLTRKYKKNILISNETKVLLSSDLLEFDEINDVRIKGKEKAVTVWSVKSKNL